MRVNFKRMKKQLGQNFIFDTNLLAAIASDAQIDGKSVVEIGMGAGTLTEQLAIRAAKVVGFEIDLDLKPVLEQRLARFPNVSARFCDFMKCDMKELEEELGGGYKGVANLPYYITTPIVCRFLDEAKKVGAMLVMVQEEVAERFCAQPDTKEYGAITVALKTAAEVKIVRRVGRKMFVPAPNVDSAVVSIVFDDEKRGGVGREALRSVVRAAFSMRRKTLLNNLSAFFKTDKAVLKDMLEKLGFSPDVRGESLSPEDFLRLSSELEGLRAV